jgi:hypothetical protein
LFQKFICHCLRHGGIKRIQINLCNGEYIQETFQQAKRVLSSVLICRLIFEVSNLEIVDIIQGNRDRTQGTKKKALRKRKSEVLNQIDTKPDMTEWNMKECRDYIQYKIVLSIPHCKQLFAVINGCSSFDCSVHESDDEEYDTAIIMNFANSHVTKDGTSNTKCIEKFVIH